MRLPLLWLTLGVACSSPTNALDARGNGVVDGGVIGDSGTLDAGTDTRVDDSRHDAQLDAPTGRDANGDTGIAGDAASDTLDSTPPPDFTTLRAARERLLGTLVTDTCGGWDALDRSARGVFITITHRLWIGRLRDGSRAIDHVTRVYSILGGGSGNDCGGRENNRLFLQIDDALWTALVETWHRRSTPLSDGSGSTWVRTRDIAGPHDPFNASNETDTGLRCFIVVETPDSRPPTAQLHFFLEGEAQAFTRGSAALPMDPRMMEIDLDYNCTHQSNPTCGDFAQRYARNYGDYDCAWTPSGCRPKGTECFGSVHAATGT